MSDLRKWGVDEVAPADATSAEIALHWALWGDLKLLAPAVPVPPQAGCSPAEGREVEWWPT